MAAVAPTAKPHKRRKKLNDFPAGFVAVPCHDLARYHQFSHDMTLLDVPDETLIEYTRSVSVVQNMNMSVQSFLDSGRDWWFCIGDDHSFRRDTILSLLRCELDIVVPLCTRRGPPFSLVIHDRECGLDEHGRQMYNTMQFSDLPEDGQPFEVASAGTAGMLVQRHVFEAISQHGPWFANSDGLTVNEDLEFCRLARAHGFRVMVDPNTRIGHIGIATAWPEYMDGRWGLTLDLHGAAVHLPGGIKLVDGEPADQVKTGHLR